MTTAPDLVRRRLMAAAVAAAGLGRAGFASARPLVLDDPRDNGFAYVKLHADVTGATDGFNGLSGMIYAVVGDGMPVAPLFGCEGFSIGRAEPLPDGRFRYRLRSVLVFTDPVTRAPLSRWRNPMTGATVEVAHTHLPSVCWIIGDAVRAGSQAAGSRPTAWTFTDDQAVYTSQGGRIADNPLDPALWPRESAGKRIRTVEFAKVICSRAQLQDDRRDSADYVGVWNSMTPWEPWMLMGQAPGYLYQTSTIRRLASAQAIDPALRAYCLTLWPGCLAAPTTWDTTNRSSLEIYARGHRPAA